MSEMFFSRDVFIDAEKSLYTMVGIHRTTAHEQPFCHKCLVVPVLRLPGHLLCTCHNLRVFPLRQLAPRTLHQVQKHLRIHRTANQNVYTIILLAPVFHFFRFEKHPHGLSCKWTDWYLHSAISDLPSTSFRPSINRVSVGFEYLVIAAQVCFPEIFRKLIPQHFGSHVRTSQMQV